MKGFFSELLKFLGDFTWKRLFALIAVLVIILICISLYERYTSSFRLIRLQKAADLLERVQRIEVAGKNNNQDLENARKELISQTAEAIKTKSLTLDFIPTTLKFSMNWIWKFFAGAALWFLIAFSQILKKRDKGTMQNTSGMFFIAGICGSFGIFVPEMWWPWFHLIIYPFLFVLCVFLASSPILFFISKSTKKQEKQT